MKQVEVLLQFSVLTSHTHTLTLTQALTCHLKKKFLPAVADVIPASWAVGNKNYVFWCPKEVNLLSQIVLTFN